MKATLTTGEHFTREVRVSSTEATDFASTRQVESLFGLIG